MGTLTSEQGVDAGILGSVCSKVSAGQRVVGRDALVRVSGADGLIIRRSQVQVLPAPPEKPQVRWHIAPIRETRHPCGGDKVGTLTACSLLYFP
jgi:hypothetical protein